MLFTHKTLRTFEVYPIIFEYGTCKECRAEARMKTENREKEDAGSMESLESRTVRGRDRERETHRKLYFKKCTHSMFSTMCVFNAHFLYKSFGGLTEVLSYFNALKERLH